MRVIFTAATLAMITISASAAEPPKLGRLFYTPEQRVALDSERQQAKINASKPVVAKAPVTPAGPKEAPRPKVVVPQDMTLNGIVRRSDGQSTVWVNSKAIQTGSAAGPVNAGSVRDDSVDVKLSSSRSVQIKVGQTASGMTGKVEETYNRRRIPKYVAPPERDSNPASPEGKPSDAPENATDATGAGTTESSTANAR